MRVRATNRKYSNTSDFNKLILLIKVPYECSRQVRCLDFSVMKAQEYRNIILYFFPLVLECIEEGAGERRLWLLFSFMIRACTVPDEEYQNIPNHLIKEISEIFYYLYETLFGPNNCTYYTHIVGSHLFEMRTHGPLTLTSAFRFENFYSELRHSFVPGTCSPLKQSLEKIFIKRQIGKHCCKSSIKFTDYETPLESNNYIYTYENNEYSFFKIVEVGRDTFNCVEIVKKVHNFPETPELNWETVGLFKMSEQKEDIVKIDVNTVKGKLIKV